MPSGKDSSTWTWPAADLAHLIASILLGNMKEKDREREERRDII